MSFAIFRMDKIKNLGSLAAQQSHVLRTVPTPNADPELSRFNRVVYGDFDALGGVQTRFEQVKKSGKRIRSDSVPAVEVLLTASPEFFRPRDFEKESAWIRENVFWLESTFGKDNVVQAVLHLDETTPHLQCVVFPRTKDGRLSARDVMGGPKELSLLQSSYAMRMSKFGLVRGIEKSKANHEDIRKHYGKMKAAERALDVRISSALSSEFKTPLKTMKP